MNFLITGANIDGASVISSPKLLPHPGVVSGIGLSVAGVSTGGAIVPCPGSVRSGSAGSPDVLQTPPISTPGVL